MEGALKSQSTTAAQRAHARQIVADLITLTEHANFDPPRGCAWEYGPPGTRARKLAARLTTCVGPHALDEFLPFVLFVAHRRHRYREYRDVYEAAERLKASLDFIRAHAREIQEAYAA
jgi:hypothetical protein